MRWMYALKVLITILLCVTLAFWSNNWSWHWDWSERGRNSLAPASQQVLAQMDQPLSITIVAKDTPLERRPLQEFVEKYRRYKDDVEINYLDPDASPQTIKKLGISKSGVLLVGYEQKSETVTDISESSITNAMYRLLRREQRLIVFLEGHGERGIYSEANFAYQVLGEELARKGFQLKSLNYLVEAKIPDDTALLVIASPQVAYLPGEVEAIKAYVNAGGSLLWFMEPDGLQGLEEIVALLGVQPYKGMVVDPSSQLYSIDDPTFAIVGEYGKHAVTRGLQSVTLFPQAVSFDVNKGLGWNVHPLLYTTQRSWIEQGVLKGVVSFNEDEDIAGPLPLAVSLERRHGDEHSDVVKNQRVMVFGDGDFLSNSYLGNGVNLALGVAVFNWLSDDDRLVNLPVAATQSKTLNLTQNQQYTIAIVFLFLLPLIALMMALWVWFRRRRL